MQTEFTQGGNYPDFKIVHILFFLISLLFRLSKIHHQVYVKVGKFCNNKYNILMEHNTHIHIHACSHARTLAWQNAKVTVVI